MRERCESFKKTTTTTAFINNSQIVSVFPQNKPKRKKSLVYLIFLFISFLLPHLVIFYAVLFCWCIVEIENDDEIIRRNRVEEFSFPHNLLNLLYIFVSIFYECMLASRHIFHSFIQFREV